MRLAMSVFLAMAKTVCGSLIAQHPPQSAPATRPAGPVFIPHLTVPPFVEERLVYFHPFDAEAPTLNRASVSATGRPVLVDEGFSGRCAAMAGGRPFVLTGAALSPHRPLTVAFWWSLPDGLERNAGGQFLAITGRTGGYISVFVRGGPWCALHDSAHVMQVYRFRGIQDHNGIFDRTLRQNVSLGRANWHLTVLTVANGAEIKLYLDGELAADHDLRGRALTEEDGLERLTLGPFAGPSGLYVDELMILDAALDGRQVRAMYDAVRSLKDIGMINAASRRRP